MLLYLLISFSCTLYGPPNLCSRTGGSIQLGVTACRPRLTTIVTASPAHKRYVQIP